MNLSTTARQLSCATLARVAEGPWEAKFQLNFAPPTTCSTLEQVVKNLSEHWGSLEQVVENLSEYWERLAQVAKNLFEYWERLSQAVFGAKTSWESEV